MTSGDQLDQALLDLRTRGLTYASLAVVAEYVYGWRLSPDHIRRRLRHFGIKPDRTRARYGPRNPLTGRAR